jgi:hypothetical protein
MSRPPKYLTLLLVLTAAGLAAPLATPAYQGNTSSVEELAKQYNDKRKNAYVQLQTGQRQPTDSDQPTLRAAAEWFIYRLKSTTLQNQPGKLHGVVRDFNETMNKAINPREIAKKTQAFQQRFNKELIICFRDVLDKSKNAQAIVNAAVMFPAWADGGREEVADFLAEQVRDPNRHEAVKLYALRGLGTYFKASPPEAGPLADAGRKERDAQRIQTVMDFVKRKSPVTPEMTPEQFEAVRYVRREAVRTLALVKVPALDVDTKKNKVLAPVAVTLLSVLAGKGAGIDPPPSFLEQMDAAIGLCHMKSSQIESYDRKLALPFIALTLAEFAKEYNEDFKNVIVQPAQRGQRIGGLYPWAALTERFQEGLKALEMNTRNYPEGKLATELNGKTTLLLTTTAKRQLAVGQPVIAELEGFARANAPKMKAAPVFRGINDKALEIPIE